MMIRKRITQSMIQALASLQRDGFLPTGDMPEVVMERPQQPQHGDFATGLPLRLARSYRLDPLLIAQRLIDEMPSQKEIGRVWVAPPGFLNFSLSESWLREQVDTIRAQAEDYSSVDVGAGASVQLEYVSVNPTGPLHVGHARGAILGSVLASILKAAGYQVTREYYVNDAGTQMGLFGRSLYTRYLQALGKQESLDPAGYQGAYLVDIAKSVLDEAGTRFLEMPENEAVQEMTDIGRIKMLEAIEQDLRLVHVEFDVWFSESSLYRGKQYALAMEILAQKGHVVEKDGAHWFTSESLGAEKDSVLVRTTGQPTYFASDVAYHYNKFLERDFQRVINIWGADHQGHVPRMKAVVESLGIAPERLNIIVAQMVTLKRGKEVLKASKRTGELVTLRELVEEVGADACRFFFLSRSAGSQMDFDLELAQRQSSENPVYYVQYAHARICSILKLAEQRGIDYEDGNVALLNASAELALIRKLLILPELVETIADTMEPHHLAHYSLEVAAAFHWFYQQCRVVSTDPTGLAQTKARLKLTDASRIVLAHTLYLMGINAPNQM